MFSVRIGLWDRLICLAHITNSSVEIIIWIYDTFDNKLGNKGDFTKYLKESCIILNFVIVSFQKVPLHPFDTLMGNFGHEWVNAAS